MHSLYKCDWVDKISSDYFALCQNMYSMEVMILPNCVGLVGISFSTKLRVDKQGEAYVLVHSLYKWDCRWIK